MNVGGGGMNVGGGGMNLGGSRIREEGGAGGVSGSAALVMEVLVVEVEGRRKERC